MKLDTLISKIKALDCGEMQSFFDKGYEGSCPCFSGTKRVEGCTVNVWGRCWRVSDNAQDLYVWGTLPKLALRKIGQEIKKKLDEQEWYNEYTLILKNPNKPKGHI